MPLRLSIPALLMSCAAAVSLIAWMLDLRLIEQEIEKQSIETAKARITRLQSTLEYLLRQRDSNGVRMEVSGLATHKDVIAVYVSDAQGRILAATQYATIGRSAEAIASTLPEDLRGRHAARIADVRSTMIGSVALSADRHTTVSYYPLLVDIEAHRLRPVRRGLVIVLADIQAAVSASLVVERMQQSNAARLARVVNLLREHEHDLAAFITNDARGKHLLAYLASFSEHSSAEEAAALKELHALRSNVEHIKDIVTMQQRYATTSGITQIVNVIDLLEDSIRLNADSLSRDGVEIVRKFDDVPSINVDKHRVLQILVNLVRNAKYACLESKRLDKRLTLHVGRVQDRLKVSVSDNGVGIAPENLTRIFSHGFTTRKDGHGFGLHSGALTARELGGTLNVHSDGIDKGAKFTLELPLNVPEPADA